MKENLTNLTYTLTFGSPKDWNPVKKMLPRAMFEAVAAPWIFGRFKKAIAGMARIKIFSLKGYLGILITGTMGVGRLSLRQECSTGDRPVILTGGIPCQVS